MNKNQCAAFIIGQAAELNARIAGMVAENMQRQHREQSMAFNQIDFENVLSEYSFGHNQLLDLIQQCQSE